VCVVARRVHRDEDYGDSPIATIDDIETGRTRIRSVERGICPTDSGEIGLIKNCATEILNKSHIKPGAGNVSVEDIIVWLMDIICVVIGAVVVGSTEVGLEDGWARLAEL